MESKEKMGNVRLKSLGLTDGVFISEHSGISVIDAGVKAPGGWSAGKAIVEAAINGCGEVSFGDIYIKNYKLPTVDICYDNTLGLKWPENPAGSELVLPEAGFGYVETSVLPDGNLLEEAAGRRQYGTLVAASPVSLTAAVFNCCKPVPAWLESMETAGFTSDEIFWAWSTCVIPVISDDKEIMATRKAAALEYGAIVSIWVRAGDLKIQKFLDSVKGCGELRIHNLSSARTFVKGSLNEAKLIEVFNL